MIDSLMNPTGPLLTKKILIPFTVENLAYKKEVWSNDKRHFWKDWKYGHASLAVDGIEDSLLPKCAIIDNYYAEVPIWMVDLGKKRDITGVVIVTWQGDGQGKMMGQK